MGSIQVRNTVTGLTEYIAAEGDGLTPETAFKPVRVMESLPTKYKALSFSSAGSHTVHTPTSGNSIELFAITVTCDPDLNIAIKEGSELVINLLQVALWGETYPPPYTYRLPINTPLILETFSPGQVQGYIRYREV